MNVLLLTRYTRRGASSRLRTIQYLPYLASRGFDVHLHSLLPDTYLERLYARQSAPWLDIAQSCIRRLQLLTQVKRVDLVWIEKELFPYLPAAIERLLVHLNVPYVADYDDAIFHVYERHPSTFVRRILGGKIDGVMRRGSLVIAGNEYLAERAERAGARHIAILPTAVDLTRYEPATGRAGNGTTRIGWIGTPITARYLPIVAPALRTLSRRFDVELVTIGSEMPMPDVRTEHRPWTESTEVEEIGRCDIGIMPLEDDAFERGKCGYKLIQYMASARPVVASPIGVNRSIVEHGRNGFLADSQDAWVDALSRLCADAALSRSMGRAGRELVERSYALDVTAPRLAELLKTAAC